MKNLDNNKKCAAIYAACNAADYLLVAKPMRGTWYYYLAPMNEQNVFNALATCEASDEGLKFRFRPSNGQFYHGANVANSEVIPFATVAEVDAKVTELRELFPSWARAINRGNAVEALIAEWFGCSWEFAPMQNGFWQYPDITTPDGLTIQVKAYGGSVTSKDLQAAIEFFKQ